MTLPAQKFLAAEKVFAVLNKHIDSSINIGMALCVSADTRHWFVICDTPTRSIAQFLEHHTAKSSSLEWKTAEAYINFINTQNSKLISQYIYTFIPDDCFSTIDLRSIRSEIEALRHAFGISELTKQAFDIHKHKAILVELR